MVFKIIDQRILMASIGGACVFLGLYNIWEHCMGYSIYPLGLVIGFIIIFFLGMYLIYNARWF